MRQPNSSLQWVEDFRGFGQADLLQLVRVMTALGFLSLDAHGREYRLDALQQYSEALAELQTFLESEYDLASNGAFLTHFLMLIYETMIADVQHQDIWSCHMDALLRIALLRRSIYGIETAPCVLRRICSIDTEALLSGVGCGKFVAHMVERDLIPAPGCHLVSLASDIRSRESSQERDTLSTMLHLDRETTMLAARLGLLAYEFRKDLAFHSLDVHQKAIAVKMRQSRVLDLQESLRYLWSVPVVCGLARLPLPVRAHRLLQRSRAMRCACIIYLHTSMWAGQRMDTLPAFDTEIASATTEILQLAQAATASDKDKSQFLVFPLFIAGFASSDGHQATQALQLLRVLEQGALSRTTSTVREALETVHDRQHKQFMHKGHSLDVDWLQIMREQALTVVNFAL